MIKEILYASDFIEKDVLNLETGDFVGIISGLLIKEEPLSVSAFAYRVEDENGHHLSFCDLSQVTDIDQQVVVIPSVQSYLPAGLKNIIGLSCLDANGKLLGKIKDCTWSSANGAIKDIIIDAADEWYGIAVSDISKLGTGAVILGVAESDVHKSAYQRAGAQNKETEDVEEMVRTLIRRVGVTLSEAGQKVGERVKQIDTDELNRDINRFTERVGKEIKNVVDTLSEQSKNARDASIDSETLSVLRDLEGFTVTSPIYDDRGDAIIVPGNVIDECIVHRAIENNKTAELYRVAVSTKNGEADE